MPQPQEVEVDIVDYYPDWMSSVKTALQNQRLCDLPLPGSHDAGAYGNIDVGSRAQGVDIPTQLECGFRYFDFRVKNNSGVFYAVHGSAMTDNNYAAIQSRRQEALQATGKPYIFQQIADFCRAHTGELVILNFSHFDNFGPDAESEFPDLIREYFAGMLVSPQNPMPTYGQCIANRQQVVAIVDEDGTWNAHPGQLDQLWSSRHCFRDRYSDKYFDVHGGAAFDNLQAKIDYTLQDQEDYLMGGGSDHRDPNKFWVTQAVLNYNAISYDGNSQNYYGAKVMNPQFRAAYKHWFQGRRRDGTTDSRLRRPNVLLMDYAGYFGPGGGRDPLGLF